MNIFKLCMNTAAAINNRIPASRFAAATNWNHVCRYCYVCSIKVV